MSTAIRARGETPFPQAGEGVFLRFTNADLKRLQQEFGPSFLAEAHERFDRWDMEFADALLAAGCKKDGQPTPVTMDGALDDVPVSQTFGVILDALYLSYHGRSFQEHVQEVSAIVAAMNESGEIPSPRSPVSTLLTSSASGPSDTGSTPESSGA